MRNTGTEARSKGGEPTQNAAADRADQVTIRRPLPAAYDDQGRTVIEHEVVEGPGAAQFVGVARLSKPGMPNVQLKFQIPAPSLGQAFERFDKYRDGKIDELNEAERKSAIKQEILCGAAAAAQPAVRKQLLTDA